MGTQSSPNIRAGSRPLASRPWLLGIFALLLGLLIVIATTIPILLKDHRRIPISIKIGTARSPIRLAIEENFPDPSLLLHNHTWYAYATNGPAGIFEPTQAAFSRLSGTFNIQLATSIDFLHWEVKDLDALPDTGDWAIQGRTNVSNFDVLIPRANVWAPSVIRRPSDGKFVLYYAATSNGPTMNPFGAATHCVRAAVAESPVGCFQALDTPLACPYEKGGAIDPYGFVDTDRSLYVVYKVDGNSIGHGGLCGNTVPPIVQTPIMLQKMMPDGVTPDGYPVEILDRTSVDGPLIEAPAVIRTHEGAYYLLYSSGCTSSPTYNIKYAIADNISGPYMRAAKPLLSTGDWGLEAPGSVSLHDNGGGRWNMALHARIEDPAGGVRAMFTTGLKLDGGLIKVTLDI